MKGWQVVNLVLIPYIIVVRWWICFFLFGTKLINENMYSHGRDKIFYLPNRLPH